MEWDEIKKRLLTGFADDVRELKSPDGEPLVVIFTPGDKPSLNIRSKKGWPRIAMDGLKHEPPWVAQLGHRFETQ